VNPVPKLSKDNNPDFTNVDKARSDYNTGLPDAGVLEHLTQTNRLRQELGGLNFGESGERLQYVRSQHINPMVEAVEMYGSKGFDIAQAPAGVVAGVQRLLRENGYTCPYSGVADRKTIDALKSATGSSRVTTESMLKLVDKYTWDQMPRAFGWDGVKGQGVAVKVHRAFNLEASFQAQFDGQKMSTVERELFKKLPTKESQQRVLEQYAELSVGGRNSHTLSILVDSERGR
jgi:hypothetical protein